MGKEKNTKVSKPSPKPKSLPKNINRNGKNNMRLSKLKLGEK